MIYVKDKLLIICYTSFIKLYDRPETCIRFGLALSCIMYDSGGRARLSQLFHSIIISVDRIVRFQPIEV